ncbi:TetR/AcrR family transcriptional regulator [uncultured Brevundimonas sp.]|uniref:TetR/AcrR family transcriptional regulator n=1 Tax=uncultured Brevundimonas sp. TaxID=213418 RepID=UPI00261F81C8|nr:TetR/AcrR family transcriptional regulator [uncultured Brevundimonas sp.]
MERPLRKDAADRRAHLLVAAREVFREEGIDAPLDRIAIRAGVGRATLYRNFPGRTEIALAVLIDEIELLVEAFAQPDGADAFFDFLTDLQTLLIRNSALGDVVRAAPSPELLAPLREAMVRAATPPLCRSQAEGRVRNDLCPKDVRILLSMLVAGLHNATPDEKDALAARARQLTFDAVRPRP